MSSIIYTILYRMPTGTSKCYALCACETQQNLDGKYRDQARELARKLDAGAPPRMVIDAGVLTFHYMIADSVIFLTLTAKAYPRQLAFSYLEEVHRAFLIYLDSKPELGGWKAAIDGVDKDFSFLSFDKTLHKIRADHVDPDSNSNTSRLTRELSGVQSIMQRSINEVLERGDKLENVAKATSNLLDGSKKYYAGAKHLNQLAAWRKYAPFILVGLLVLAILYWRFFT